MLGAIVSQDPGQQPQPQPQPQQKPQPQPQPQPQQQQPQQQKPPGSRPLGVTIICILGFIGAILGIVGVAGFFLLAGLLGTMLAMEIPVLGAMLAGLMEIVMGAFAVIQVVLLLGLIWLWQMKKKGWTIVVIFEIIGIVFALLSGMVIGAIIPVIIVLYLFTKKNLFS